MRIVHYCQHVLGMGHFFRSLEIDKALCGHEVTLITGGTPVEIALPAHVMHEELPPLMMDKDFSRFVCMGGYEECEIDPEKELQRIRTTRAARLMEIMERVRPHVFLVELFPFGRKQFGFELLPVLERARRGDFGSMKTLCSLRDILVEKDNQADYEERVISVLNPLFQGVLVHTDPSVVRLEETFSRTMDITIPVLDTGYVTSLPQHTDSQTLRCELGIPNDQPFIIASAGSGSVGYELLKASVLASCELIKSLPHRLQVFTGPFMDQIQQNLLKKAADTYPHISIQNFTDRFVDYLCAADLSISMAGYNTTMNLLSTGIFGLVQPFDQNREQRMRSERLAAQGALGILEEQDLTPSRLAVRMRTALQNMQGRNQASLRVDLNGAHRSAELIEQLFSPWAESSPKGKKVNAC